MNTNNRIEQVINDIEEYIEGCKLAAFSSTKIVVERTQLEDFLAELREYTPEEVKKYQRIINNRDKILSDAKKKAEEIEDKAQAYAEHMAQESQITKMAENNAQEIMLQAQDQANALIAEANHDSREIREGALSYASELLGSIESIVSGTIDDYQARYSAMISSLSEHHNIIVQNIKEVQNTKIPGDEPEDTAQSDFFTSDYSEDIERNAFKTPVKTDDDEDFD